MAEIRPKIAALCLVLTGLLATAVLAGEPRCTEGKTALEEHRSGKGDTVVALPTSWECDVRELSDGLIVEDLDKGCTLEFLRSPGLLSLEEAVQLYESLYLGTNRLDADCEEEVKAKILWSSDCRVREYRPRDRGKTIQALFATLDGEIIVALLKCPAAVDDRPDWATAAGIFASYRKPSGKPFRWSAGTGLFGPLYFLMKIPFNQFQNPD